MAEQKARIVELGGYFVRLVFFLGVFFVVLLGLKLKVETDDARLLGVKIGADF